MGYELIKDRFPVYFQPMATFKGVYLIIHNIYNNMHLYNVLTSTSASCGKNVVA